MVGREAKPPGQEPDAATHRVSDDPDVRARAVQRCEPVAASGVDHLRPAGASLDCCGAPARIDFDAVHASGADQHRAICGRGGPVPGVHDGDGAASVRRHVDRVHDVRRARGVDDQLGPVLECDVEPGAEVLVAGIAWQQERQRKAHAWIVRDTAGRRS